MCGTVAGLLASGCQDPGSHRRCQHARALPGVEGVQTVDSVLKKPLLPANDRRRGRLQPLFDDAEGGTLCKKKNQSGTKHVSRWQGAGLSDGSKFETLIVG
jgi:hypothetical protein